MAKGSSSTRHDGTVVQVRATGDGVTGTTLGDLRALVAQTEGIPDTADVLLEGLHASVLYVGRYRASTVIVRHEQLERRA